MRRSIATVCLSGTLEEKLEAAAAAGFDGVELFENDLIASPLPPGEVRRRADALGLSIDLYQPFRDFEAMPELDLRRAEAKFELMEALGAPTMLVCSNVSPQAIDDDELAAQHLHTLAERAAEHGLRIAYEALAWGRHVSEYDHAWRIVEAADHPALGTCLDSFHILSRGTDLGAIADIPGEKIFYLQLADAPHLRMDVLQWSRHYRCFPGQGAFDLRDFLARVLAAGYAGPLSLEVFNDVFRQADPQRTAIDAMRSLLAARGRSAGARARSTASRSWRSASTPTRRPTPRRCCARWASTTPARTAASRCTCGSTARSGSCSTTASAATTPRSSRSPSRAATRTRARPAREALLAPVLERRRGAGEADLAAIAAPDGTSVFLCGGDGWLADFLATGEDGGEPVPIERIDHITLAQPFEAFDEAGLFYRGVLGLEPGDRVELAAPDGLLRSRALAAGGVRVALNVPALAGTLRGQAELQHVAFACADALAAARAMRERGVPLLPIPDNYYDDLAARLDLDPALLEALRELGVLYDRGCRGRAPALLHRPRRRPRVLRGARAARRLRRLRSRQLTGADGVPARRP